jgi:LysM repeat protein
LIYNSSMQFRLNIYLVICLFLMAGCSSRVTPASTPTSDLLVPYITQTLTPLPEETATSTPEIILPTSTPLTYTIVAGDTFGSIADRFGVRLDDLMAANPGTSPNALSVGITIVIPNAPVSTAIAAPTPASVTLAGINCWPTIDGGLWCFVSVTNSTNDLLENLAAQVSLISTDGTVVTSQTALAPLDILPPGKSTALTAFFAPPVPQGITPQAQLTTAIRILSNDTRYAPAVVQNSLVQTDWSGTTANLSGLVQLTGDSPPAEVSAHRVWVAAVAYDASGQVVGTRRWESSVPLTAGMPISFDFQVASVDSTIDRVDIQVEARP